MTAMGGTTPAPPPTAPIPLGGCIEEARATAGPTLAPAVCCDPTTTLVAPSLLTEPIKGACASTSAWSPLAIGVAGTALALLGGPSSTVALVLGPLSKVAFGVAAKSGGGSVLLRISGGTVVAVAFFRVLPKCRRAEGAVSADDEACCTGISGWGALAATVALLSASRSR